MPSCPNINTPEWKALVDNPKIGLFQAYKDYFETGTIRTPGEVLNKLDQRFTKSKVKNTNPNVQQLYKEYGMNTEVNLNTDAIKQDVAVSFADKLAYSLGVDYEIITPKEAENITKSATNPWTGEAAFFFGDKVYFIADRMSTDLVLHEFAHPLIRSISKENKKLFNTLYDQIAGTDEGLNIINNVREAYDTLEDTSDFFKEEVIVRALENLYSKQNSIVTPTNKFKAAIKNLLYNIKQALRKLFGRKLPVSKLSENTTLGELLNMLTSGEKFSLNKELITNEDIVAYNKQMINALTKDLQHIDKTNIQATINSFYDKLSSNINMLTKNKNYNELARIIMNVTGNENLQDMKRNLNAWQTKVIRETEKLQDEIKEGQSRVNSLANSLFTLDSIMNKIKQHSLDLKENAETKEAMHKAHYYKKIIDYWDGFIKELEKTMDDADVPNNSSLVNLVNSIRRNITKSNNAINTMMEEGAIDGLWQQLAPISKNLNDRYQRIINDLEKRNAPPGKINRIYIEFYGMTKEQLQRFNTLSQRKKDKSTLSIQDNNEYNKLARLSKSGLNVSKDKIRSLITGEMGDANYFNSFLEGYLYNTDPIVGGLALYVKNALNDVMIVSQAKFNSFAEDMRPLLKAAGYNPRKVGKLGEDVGFVDLVGRINSETGEFEQRKVWSLTGRFKNYRYDEDYLENMVKVTHDNWVTYGKDEDKRAHIEAKAALRDFEINYMNQENVKEYYERKRDLQKTQTGRAALAFLEDFFQRLNEVTEPNRTEIDKIDNYDLIQTLWREYRQAFSSYDLNGKLKSTAIDPATGASPAAMAEELRKYRDKGRQFYEWKIRTNAFEKAYRDYQQELLAEGVDENHPDFKSRMDLWKEKNTRFVIKDEYFELKRQKIESIKKILSKLKDSEEQGAAEELDQSLVWEKILEITGRVRDTDNQIEGTELSKGEIATVKELQEKLEDLKENVVGKSGLSPNEYSTLNKLFKIKEKRDLTSKEEAMLFSLYDKKRKRKLSGADSANLERLYRELGEMTSKSATSYYIDIVNNWLSKLNTNALFLETGKRTIDINDADVLYEDHVIQPLLKQNAEFAEWFKNNHLAVNVFNKETNDVDLKYKRLYVWNTTMPSDPNMIETYKIKDSLGNVETIYGMPAMTYYYRSIKPEYKTRKIPGVTVDNRGRWLPLSREDMAKSEVTDKFKYINEKYYDMQQNQPELFAVLEKLTEHHLKNQEGLSRNSKLYLDFPRFQKDTLEGLQSTSLDDAKKKGYTGLTWLAKRIRGLFKREADDAQQGLNESEQFNLVRVDMFDNEVTNIPIAGLYNLDVDDVSTNITYTMMRYMFSAERQKQLIEISPFVRSVQQTIKNRPLLDTKKIDKDNFLNRQIIRYIPKKGDVRKKAVDSLIEREFEGINQVGLGADNATLHNLSNLLFKRASFAFFALNIPSALKNSLGMKFQQMIEAAGGEHLDLPSLGKGKAWAYGVMAEYSGKRLYQKRGALTLKHQLVEIFDPVQDRFAENFGERLSRTTTADAASMSWLYSIRKWVEIQAALEMFAGMMYKQKVERIVNGEKKEISYIDAFEVNDEKQIVLKSGIDVRYGKKPTLHKITSNDTIESLAAQYNVPVDILSEILEGQDFSDKLARSKREEINRKGELDELGPVDEEADVLVRQKYQDKIDRINNKYDKIVDDILTIKIDNSLFKSFKNKHQQVQNDMGGAYAKFDQPDAQRYIWFRFISYMRRYFTTMALKRWGFSGSITNPRARFNPGLGGAQMGYYVEAGKTLIDIVKSGGTELPYMTQSEKAAMIKFGTEVVMLWLTMMAFGLFGWDPDDEKKIAKLKEKTGALPFFGLTEDDAGRPFKLGGYLQVHALHLLMQVRAENEQFNLLTGGIANYNSLTDIKSVAFGPTTDSYVQIWNDLMNEMSNSPKAKYTREVGPYSWQQKGGSKWLAHLATSFGLTGSTLDPVKAIKGFQGYQAKVKR